jgi:putative transposase
MVQLNHPLLFLLARSTSDDLQKQVEFLKAENELLRKRVPRKRIFLKPNERARLLNLGRELGPAIRQIITIVDYSTFRRWVRKEEGLDARAGKGRPRIAMIIRELVVQMARETGWGYSRILGELRKLGVGRISRQTVKNILVEHGFEPGPRRGRGTWSEFLKIHADTLWQVDFFSKRIWTLQGPRQAFAMAFVHVAIRRVFVTPATCRPDAGWMKSQAESFLSFTDGQQIDCDILIRDRDGKYSSDFDRCFTNRGIKVKPVGPRAPNLNAFAERWIQSLKHEALNHFVVFSLEHFDHIVGEFVLYYHECRPHQGIGNRLIGAEENGQPPAVTNLDQVRCEKRLGGLLKHYYRAA